MLVCFVPVPDHLSYRETSTNLGRHQQHGQAPSSSPSSGPSSPSSGSDAIYEEKRPNGEQMLLSRDCRLLGQRHNRRCRNTTVQSNKYQSGTGEKNITMLEFVFFYMFSIHAFGWFCLCSFRRVFSLFFRQYTHAYFDDELNRFSFTVLDLFLADVV